MKHQHKAKINFPLKTTITMALILSVISICLLSFKPGNGEVNDDLINQDSIASVKAFEQVYKVLMSPRCMNCHPSGDIPLQGDDSHLHTMFPNRGEDGKGMYAMKCTNCHQPENTAGLHTPPGNPNWHLPPADMKMVFQGRTPHQLAKQLMDPKQNGNKTKAQLMEHAHDGLVMSAWTPGEGRTLPPMSHEAFTKAWITWLEKGGYAPNP